MNRNRRRPAGPVAALVVGGAVVLALCVGGGGGSIAGIATGGPSGPTAPPELPAAFPGADQGYLPDVTVDRLESWMTVDNDFVCEEEDDELARWTDAEFELQCRNDTSNAYLDIEYDDRDSVREVRGSCTPGPSTTAEYCQDFFSILAHTVLAEQPELQEEAQRWGEENADNNAHTVIGGMVLSISLSGFMRVTPAG